MNMAAEAIKDIYKELVTELHGADQIAGLEKGRVCLESITSFCQVSPEQCMRNKYSTERRLKKFLLHRISAFANKEN
ncbi:unnamed protein product [Larinioides sclopetarius]|uniref:Uncharacterized protein n=1 Tax=Larinioides sclopetarius TaxID=280406 RepID=A0AAV2AC11_9ARAC